jgi:alkanesulfonate monooxygenase SsuD/methylene tetrahydromethanopterin reductase-like flavin-dependent oxidoreductase (luciferase family)
MRLGGAVPLHGRAAQPEGLLTMARRAEGLCYASLWVGDHLLVPVNMSWLYAIFTERAFSALLEVVEVVIAAMIGLHSASAKAPTTPRRFRRRCPSR